MGELKKTFKLLGTMLFVLALLFVLTRCSSDSGGENIMEQTTDQNNEPIPDNTDDDTTGATDNDGVAMTVWTNPADSQWFTATHDDGITVNYHGSKDTAGIPEDLEQIEIIEDELNGAVFHVNEQNRISEMVYADGTLFRFDWKSDTAANITVIANNGSIQVNTEIDFNQSGKSGSFSKTRSAWKTLREEGLTIERTKILEENIAKTTSKNQEVLLNVSQCGELTDAPLPPYFEIIDGEGNLLRTLFTKKIGLGVYTVDVPIPEPVDPNVQLLCASLSSKISDLCTALDFSPDLASLSICAKVTDALDNLPFGVDDEVKAGVLFACEKMVVDYLPIACKRLNEGGTTINEKLCAAEASDFVLPVISRMYGVIPVAPIDKVTESVLLQPEASSIPDFNLDLGDDTVISDLNLNPTSPTANQNYSAIVSLGCVAQGTIIEITVTGSDGFSDTVTYNETSTLASADYTIGVPGANQGVQDTITVTITTPDGIILNRTASLVFG